MTFLGVAVSDTVGDLLGLMATLVGDTFSSRSP